MKQKTYNIALIIYIIALVCGICISIGCIISAKRAIEAEQREAELIELVKADILDEWKFKRVEWLEVEKVNPSDDTGEFYIITCLTENDELVYYAFAAVVKESEITGEMDVDTWPIKYYGLSR